AEPGLDAAARERRGLYRGRGDEPWGGHRLLHRLLHRPPAGDRHRHRRDLLRRGCGPRRDLGAAARLAWPDRGGSGGGDGPRREQPHLRHHRHGRRRHHPAAHGEWRLRRAADGAERHLASAAAGGRDGDAADAREARQPRPGGGDGLPAAGLADRQRRTLGADHLVRRPAPGEGAVAERGEFRPVFPDGHHPLRGDLQDPAGPRDRLARRAGGRVGHGLPLHDRQDADRLVCRQQQRGDRLRRRRGADGGAALGLLLGAGLPARGGVHPGLGRAAGKPGGPGGAGRGAASPRAGPQGSEAGRNQAFPRRRRGDGAGAGGVPAEEI
ncbi:MAG: Ribonuclease BN, partial [uncultured Craurococcus sp.]